MTAAEFYKASKGDLENEFKAQKPWTEHESVSCFFHHKMEAMFLVVTEEKEDDKSWLDTQVFSVTVSIRGEWEIKEMRTV